MSEVVTATPEASPVVETPVTEAKPTLEAPKEESKIDPLDLSRKFAALMKREKLLTQREKETNDKWSEVEKLQKAKLKAKDDIGSFLQEHGLTYKEVTDYYLNGGTPTVEMKLRRLEEQIEQDKLKRDEDEATKRQSELDSQNERVIESHKRQVKEFIDSKPEDFELIKANDAHDEVFNVIESYWQKTGQILPMDKAAAHVEEEFLNETKKLFELKKVKSFYEPKKEEEAKEVATPMPSVVPRMVPSSPKTLTNQMAAQVAPAKQVSSYLSEDESKRKMAEFLKSQMR